MWMHDGGDVPTEERGDLAWRDIFADSVVPPHLLLVRTHNLLAAGARDDLACQARTLMAS